MTMNASELLNQLNNIDSAAKTREQNERIATMHDCLAGLKKAGALVEKLREIRPVVEKLLSMKIGFVGYWQNEFLTDGISHRWGFARGNMRYFGAEAGGADGVYNMFLDLDTERWTDGDPSGSASFYTQTAEDFAKFSVEPYTSCGRVIESKKYFIVKGAKTMESGIQAYLDKVEKTVMGLK